MFDIIRDGFDLAIRIGELEDSTLVAKKTGARHPHDLCRAQVSRGSRCSDLPGGSAGAQLPVLRRPRRVAPRKPEGQQHQLRLSGNLRSNSAEFTRQAIMSGLGIGLRSTWDIGPELQSGKLRVVLPEYCGSSNVAIYAVYPSREFMPSKVNVFIEFLSELYAPEPYWNKDLDLDELKSSNSTAA